MGTWSGNAYSACPHCGQRIGNTVFGRHTATCIHRADLRPVMRAALDFGDGSIKTRDHYNATRGKCLSVNAILKQLGTYNWEDVANLFGLRYEREFRPWRHLVSGTPIVARGYATLPAEKPEPVTVCGLPATNDSPRICTYLAERRTRQPDGVYLEVRRVVEERYVLR